MAGAEQHLRGGGGVGGGPWHLASYYGSSKVSFNSGVALGIQGF